MKHILFSADPPERSIRNCELILTAGEATLGHVVQVVILLEDPQAFDSMDKAYARVISKDRPARAVARLGVDVPDVLVQVMMTAVTQ
jgi:2-iminobutanoate/2-iminopropanoate deaminase